MKPFVLNKILGFIPKIGDRVHLHTLQGHYEIVSMLEKGVVITCNVWQARANYPNTLITRFVLYKDIKTLHREKYNVTTNANATNR